MYLLQSGINIKREIIMKKGKSFGFFCNGSIGKSRLSSSIAVALAQADETKSVALIDLDIGGPSQEIYNQEIIKTPNKYLHEFIEGKQNESLDDVITKTKIDNYDLLLWDIAHKSNLNDDSYKKLKKGVDELKTKYDFVFLDIGSTFDHSSTDAGKNCDDLSELVAIPDERFLVSVANDAGKIMSRGVKTVKDYVFHSIKKSALDCLVKNGYDIKTYAPLINELLQKNYDKVEDFSEDLMMSLKDVEVKDILSRDIKNTVKNTEVGVIFNQLNNMTELFYNYIILGKGITNISENDDGIKINNMRGYGHFSFDHDTISKLNNKPITFSDKLAYKTLFKEIKNSANYFLSNKEDKSGSFRKMHNKRTMDSAFKKYIEKEKLEM